MNKQQLANKIWASANKMRSKIEANEYKDYILGFIFYKFLSDQEEKFLYANGCTEDEIVTIKEPENEDDPNKDIMEHCQKNLGYFISYKYLFSTWIKPRRAGEEAFSVGDVRDALNAFSRLIFPTHKKVFEGIFDILRDGLTKLGESATSQTKAIFDLLQLIKDMPTDGSQDYDILGFIYEYLIGKFAANAGKKAGEFYTPHEVSLLMAEIVAYHLRDRKKIEIYDPTSGSGSLLLNIGRAAAKHIEDKDQIKYYAQELKQNTYNLTRMNLVMRGIKPANIETRNGDTLEQDWPMFDESDPAGTYHPLYVDAVVSNPPYSQEWAPKDKEFDPRYSRFGLAPKGTADYAFLLHDLFHIKPDGIMTIVLPHGVLFRGGEEEKIRMNLIENNHVDAIIGLPPNIFFGTGIPTLIMVLKQKRQNTDTLFIDGSRCFEKVGTDNKLRASDIKKLADAYIERNPSDPTFAALVSRETIRANGYNLNIPRYIEPYERQENWDIYATMFGGIPKSEIDDLHEYWDAFPSLRDELFGDRNQPYAHLVPKIAMDTILKNEDVKAYMSKFRHSLDTFPEYLKQRLIDSIMSINIDKEENVIANEIFSRLGEIPLIDKYSAYEILDKKWADNEADNFDKWTNIASDIEVIQSEGFEATRQIDPHMVIKKDKDNKEYEVQDGWQGHILPFNLVQTTLLKNDWLEWQYKEKEVKELTEKLEDAPNSFDELDLKTDIWSDEKNDFIPAGIKARVAHILSEVSSPEIESLYNYLDLLNNKAKKQEKLTFISACAVVKWSKMEASKDGTYAKAAVNKYIAQLQSEFVFPEDSLEARVLYVNRIIEDLKSAKKAAKILALELQEKTRAIIPSIPDEDVKKMLYEKWGRPLVSSLDDIPMQILIGLSSKIKNLVDKYFDVVKYISNEKKIARNELAELIQEMTGDEYAKSALQYLQSTLKSNDVAKLKDIKKSLRYMMFPQKGNLLPKIRFKKFSNNWSLKKLSECLTICEDTCDGNYTKFDVLSVSGDYGIVNQIAYQGKSFAGASISNYRVVKLGNVVYTKSPLKANPYGIIKSAKDETGIVSPLYAVYSVSSESDPDFIQVYFDDDITLNNYLRPLVNKGAKNTILISDEIAISGNVVFPCREEQVLVAKVFLCIEKLILLTKRDFENRVSIKVSEIN